MKNSIRWETIPIAFGLSILVEVIPVFTRFETINRIAYAIVAIVLSIIIENKLNQKKFIAEIKVFIKSLKELRTNNTLTPEATQAIMRLITQQLAVVLDQSKTLDRDTDRDSGVENGVLPCSICGKNHLTDYYSKCQNCKIKSKLWKELKQYE